MPYLDDGKMERTISIVEHVLFWILILAIIATVIWLAFGSPEFEKSLLMIMIFVAGFERVRPDFKQVNSRLDVMGNGISGIKSKLINIKNDVSNIKNSILKINK